MQLPLCILALVLFVVAYVDPVGVELGVVALQLLSDVSPHRAPTRPPQQHPLHQNLVLQGGEGPQAGGGQFGNPLRHILAQLGRLAHLSSHGKPVRCVTRVYEDRLDELQDLLVRPGQRRERLPVLGYVFTKTRFSLIFAHTCVPGDEIPLAAVQLASLQDLFSRSGHAFNRSWSWANAQVTMRFDREL
ncbi:hypothetical protein B484DRAFT_68305 [Ochromonadaceae sp. CCMP2298]|nr:hypothetical protein B484DRAFT_68305 [Ochromonadaceae sp. CCMP2298]